MKLIQRRFAGVALALLLGITLLGVAPLQTSALLGAAPEQASALQVHIIVPDAGCGNRPCHT